MHSPVLDTACVILVAHNIQVTHLGPIVHHFHWQLRGQLLPQQAQQDVGIPQVGAAATNDQDASAWWLISTVVVPQRCHSCCSKAAGIEACRQQLLVYQQLLRLLHAHPLWKLAVLQRCCRDLEGRAAANGCPG